MKLNDVSDAKNDDPTFLSNNSHYFIKRTDESLEFNIGRNKYLG